MKVLLIEPPKLRWEMMGDYVAPPVGLAQVAACLQQHNIDVSILDCNALEMSYDDIASQIRQTKPDIVGATCYTPFFYDSIRSMQFAKKINPEIITVLGGPHVTYTIEETLSNNDCIDFIVRNEGDRVFPELIDAISNNRSLAEVKGIAYRAGDTIIQTPQAPLVDVNQLPIPAYNLLPMQTYRFPVFGDFVSVTASRGCPHQCLFCSEWDFWGARWRPREIEFILEEIELLVKQYHISSIWFGDDCFNVDGDRIEQFCAGIIRRNLKFNWYFQGRADMIVHHQRLLPLMRKTGNRMVQIGIEAATDDELVALNKHLAQNQITQAVALLKKHDIVVQGMMIIGTRNDDPKSIMHKVRTMKWLDVDFPVFTFFTPFPGSKLFSQAKANGWLEIEDYSLYDMAHPIISTEHLSLSRLWYWYAWCYKSYFFDPIKLTKGLFSRNKWKRNSWWRMIDYSLKQIFRSLKRAFSLSKHIKGGVSK